MVFFAVILGVFSSLWRADARGGHAVVGDPRTLVWYLASTEWILLSAPLIHVDIQEAIRRGDVVYQLGRPVSYVGAAFAEGLGLLAIRAPLLAVTAFLCAFAFTGWIPPLRALAAVAGFGCRVGAAHGAPSRDRAAGLLARGCLAGVLGVAEAAVRPRRPDAAARAVSRVDAAFAALTPFPVILAGPASFVLEGAAVAPHVLAGAARDLGRSDHGVLCAGCTRGRRRELTINGG